MQNIILTNSHVCSYTDVQDREYVFFTGGVAGISDRADLQDDAEAFERRADEVQLERK